MQHHDNGKLGKETTRKTNRNKGSKDSNRNWKHVSIQNRIFFSVATLVDSIDFQLTFTPHILQSMHN